jgi:hypothetical protein
LYSIAWGNQGSKSAALNFIFIGSTGEAVI